MNISQLPLSHMPASKRGRRTELEYCTEIYERTDGRLFAEPVGYSGNHDVPSPDFTVDDGTKLHAFEWKTSKQDRTSVVYDPDDRGNDDLAQLIHYARDYPRTVVAHVGVTFTRRQATVATLYVGAETPEQVLQAGVESCETSVNLTHAGNLSFHRPTTDEWFSEQKGDDVGYILDRIGYDGPRLPP